MRNRGPTRGFTLIEMMLTLTIIGIVAALIVPQLRRRPVKVRTVMLNRLNAITHLGLLNAKMQRTLHRVILDLKGRTISLEAETGERDSMQSKRFAVVKIPHATTSAEIPAGVEIEHLYVGGRDLLARFDMTINEVWFYIMPAGLAQEVKISALDTQTNLPFSLIINPFTARFSLEE